MTTLISFLGKGRSSSPDKNQSNPSNNQVSQGYNTTDYLFDDGQIFEKQKYFGLAVAEKIKPNKIILLGTASSMWDVFLEEGGENLTDEWVNLSEAVKNQAVTEELLAPFEDYLKQKFSTQIHCILIPFAKDTAEQIALLSLLSEHLTEKEKIVLDVTHSFRHLPMLSLVAARFLKRIKNIDVEHIYYGAWEMRTKDGKAPVLMLDGMLSMLDWIDALTTFDKDGDYGEFAPLLIKEGLAENDAKQLKQAAFFERTTNSSQAKEKLSSVFKSLENLNSDLYRLFKPQLTKRLQWFKQENRGLREQQLAKEYLHRRDYLRAVIYAMEGIISHALYQNKEDVNNHDARKEQSDALAEQNQSFKELRPIRNTLAHGNRNGGAKNIATNEQRLQQSLHDRFKHLLE